MCVHPSVLHHLRYSRRPLEQPYYYARCYAGAGNCRPGAPIAEQRRGGEREEEGAVVWNLVSPAPLHRRLDGGSGVLRLLLL